MHTLRRRFASAGLGSTDRWRALQRHQVVDLPPIEPVVTEYQYPKVVCPSCGKGTRATIAPEIQSGQGEQLTALIAYLTIVRKMTRRDVEGLLQDLLHLSLSVGTIQKAWEETSDAVQAPYQELEPVSYTHLR